MYLDSVVKEIFAGNYEVVQYQVKVDASDLSSGVYFYKLETGSFVSKKELKVTKKRER